MRYPIRHIVFEVTRQCNLDCIYCYNHWHRDIGPDMVYSFSKASRTLREIHRNIHFNHITFTGGEPFLADGLNELVLSCRMHKKGVTVISNGTVGKEDDYTMLADLGVSLFQFPLLSYSAEIHDTLTQHQGAFNNVLRSIEILAKKHIECALVFVLTKMNAELLGDTIDFAVRLGIRRFLLARFNIGGRGIQHTKELVPSLQALRTAFKTANDIAADHKIHITSNVCVPFCIINPVDYPNIFIASCAAQADKRPVTIDFEGNVRMCNHSPVIMGNIYNRDMHPIMKSDYSRSWEESQPEFCLACSKWQKCRGGCRAASEQTGLTLNNEDPVIRLLHKEMTIKEESLVTSQH